MSAIANYTYEEITIGQTAAYSKTVSVEDIQLFAAVSGDRNPVHLDETFARDSLFGRCIAHGMLTGAVVSAALAMELPGPGSIYRNQSLGFRKPVYPGDTLRAQLEVTAKQDRGHVVTLDCKVYNQDDLLVASGTAEVIAPAEKLSVVPAQLPTIHIENS